MKKKLLVSFAVLVLFILPFLISIAISRNSPYVETNSFQTYVIICTAISIAIVLMVLLGLKYYPKPYEGGLIAGVLLFLILCPLFGIFGLATAPDVSVTMLEHPEREHLRYIFEFLAAILFGASILIFLISNSLQIKESTKWVMTLILFVAFAEFIWEFYHHYLYPEGMKEWVGEGKNAEEFKESYDSKTILNIGVIGRYFQFILIIWLSLHLYKLRQIKIWCPIINTIFSILGIASATIVYITGFPFPKGFEFLLLFFIPGIPFFLLYWLGVALLTKFKKSEIAT